MLRRMSLKILVFFPPFFFPDVGIGAPLLFFSPSAEDLYVPSPPQKIIRVTRNFPFPPPLVLFSLPEFLDCALLSLSYGASGGVNLRRFS